MKYQVFRGLRKLMYAEVTEDPVSGEETWGQWKELAGLQTAEFAPSESVETIYFDNKPAIIFEAEGDKVYTFTTSVPNLETRAAISGKTYSTTKKCILGTKTKKKYYAVGFVYGMNDGEEYITVVLKGKFGGMSESYTTADNSTTHNTMQLTFNAVMPNKAVTYEGSKTAPMAYYTLPWSQQDETKYLNKGTMVPTTID